jgi:TrmH family RNA methyltransferase
MISNSRNYPLKPLKWYKNLATIHGRIEEGSFIIEGDKGIRQIISSHQGAIIEIVAIEKPAAIYDQYPVRILTETQFRSICSSKTPQGILAVIRTPEDAYSDQLPANTGNRILLLEDIQDPGNIGTLIRTAAAFDFSGVILSEKCADPFSPKCVQSTAGSVLSVWLRRNKNYLDMAKSLQKKEYAVTATDLAGTEAPSVFEHPEKLLLALGNEAAGLSRSVLETADHHVKIPIVCDKAESLNVAVSGAILMYLSSRRD